jgi:hypothetical protein
MNNLKCFEVDTYLGNLKNYSSIHAFRTPTGELYIVIAAPNNAREARLLAGDEALSYYKLIEKKEYRYEQ